jgi:2,5-furandicarboxylate decarboxylase 1
MPDETHSISGPYGRIKIFNFLTEAGFRPKAVRSSRAGTLVSLDHPKPGEGKAAVLALLSQFQIKKALVFDDDIDIFNNAEVAWAEALRVQPDQDVIVVTGVAAKHLDPSVRHFNLPGGRLPLTDKIGVDATIPPDIPRSAYERSRYFNPRGLNVEEY